MIKILITIQSVQAFKCGGMVLGKIICIIICYTLLFFFSSGRKSGSPIVETDKDFAMALGIINSKGQSCQVSVEFDVDEYKKYHLRKAKRQHVCNSFLFAFVGSFLLRKILPKT